MNLDRAWEQAWSLENIDAHEEAGKNQEYIGSREKGNRIYDFFQDDQGHYWYRCGSAGQMDRPYLKRKASSGIGSGIRKSDERKDHEN